MPLPEEVTQAVEKLVKVAEQLQTDATLVKFKGDERVKKALGRGVEAKAAKGGGLGFLTGLVTKFQKAHKPKNTDTVDAAQKFVQAVDMALNTSKGALQQLATIKDLQERYPSLGKTLVNLNASLKSANEGLTQTNNDYQAAKKKEMAIFTEFMSYLDSKEAMKEGDKKEYKLWKKTIEETIKELSAKE